MIRSSTLACGRLRGALLRDGRYRIAAASAVARGLSSAASSSLLGHSPMAPHLPSPSSTGTQIPTAHDVSTSGGVWAPSSAKREKLKELRGELIELKDATKTSLDDVATPEERLDLYLADGIAAVVSTTDSVDAFSSEGAGDELESVIRSIEEAFPSRELTKAQWESALTSVAKLLEARLAVIPPERCLRDIRDFYVPPTVGATETALDSDSRGEQNALTEHDHARDAILRFRLLLALGAAEHLQESWVTLTTVSDQDIDRAAVAGTAVDKQAGTMDAEKAKLVLMAYLTKDCAERTRAMWALMDRDGDGLIDESEMSLVCQLTVEPVRKALARIFREALDASPVRNASAAQPDASIDNVKVGAINPTTMKPVGWRQRRKEAKEKKKLIKLFQRTLETHFVDEVEMPHRMRCIYAWANKEHQNNTIDSVLVDEAGWSGRKRYVELHPKIALAEFKEVQQEHFIHLDRVGGEFLKGFREHLWVIQGRHRQRRALYRNCTLFLIGISIVDYAILAM